MCVQLNLASQKNQSELECYNSFLDSDGPEATVSVATYVCNVAFLFLFLSPIFGAHHKTVITDPLWPDFYRGGGTPLNGPLICDQIRTERWFVEHLIFKVQEYF